MPHFLESAAEGDYGRNGAAGTLPRNKVLDFVADHGFCECSLFFAFGKVFANDRSEVVDVVEKNLFQLTGRRVYVSRQPDVYDEQGAVSAGVHDAVDGGGAEQRRRSPGCRHHDVGTQKFVVYRRPRHGCASDLSCKRIGPRQRATAYRDSLHLLRLQVRCR